RERTRVLVARRRGAHDRHPRTPGPAERRRCARDSSPGCGQHDQHDVDHGGVDGPHHRRGMTATTVVRRRRSTELTLIVMAAAVTAIAYVLASLGANAVIPARIGPFLLLVLGLIVAAHLAVRLLARGADPTLLPLAVLLHGIGYVMITRLDDKLAGLQSAWSFVAVVAFVATLLFVQRPGDLQRYRWTLFFCGAAMLMLPMVPGFGATINGARIWVSLGPLNFQPGEFAKLALAIFFAAYLADRREL